MSSRDVFYFNTWYRGHNNARYAELLPRLDRVERYLLTFPRTRVLRAASERGWRMTRRPLEPLVLRALERRHPNAFVTDVRQLASLRAPFVIDLDDVDFTDASASLLRAPNMTAYTVTDASTARRLESFGVDRPWYVVPQGAALDTLDPDAVRQIGEANRDGDTCVIGYVAAFLLLPGDRGGHDTLYNIEHLLELWDEIAQRVPEASLWLVGQPSAEVERRIAGRRDIRLIGSVPKASVMSYVANFDVALYPRTEGRGIRASKIAEYLGAGVPVVSYDYEVVEDVREAGAGILVDTPREFVEAVERVVRDDALRGALAGAAKAAGAERDWRVLSARVADVLDRHLPPA
jgi:glycosyltransferase involved in cell wall biosynthesis